MVSSKLAKLFDPLGLYLPCTIKGKIFLRSLWQSKVGWDDKLSGDLCAEWDKISKNLSELDEIKFDRRVTDSESKNTLIVFCDSSKDAYGFASYVHESESSSSRLIFAKSKVAPLKTKTLPTLELLSIYLAMKCLPTFLTQNYNFTKVFMCSDSQVALSWVLTKCVKSKNIFARNRVSDITSMLSEYSMKFDLKVGFKYVPTDLNPSDLLTRGLTLDQFKVYFEFWDKGPKFLQHKK